MERATQVSIRVALLCAPIVVGALLRPGSPTAPEVGTGQRKIRTPANSPARPGPVHGGKVLADPGPTPGDDRPAPAPPEQGTSTAESDEALFKDFVEFERADVIDAGEIRDIFTRISELRPPSARAFIARFWSANGPDHEGHRNAAMQLVLACGGTDAAAFTHLLLNDPTLETQLRDTLLRALGGLHGYPLSSRKLPVDDALASTAITLCQSTNPLIRQAGAGLLGGVTTSASRERLQQLARDDPDLGVKTVAVRSLGRVGDASTRRLLERLQSIDTVEPDGLRFRGAVDAALDELEGRPR